MNTNINPFIVSGKIAPPYFCDRQKATRWRKLFVTVLKSLSTSFGYDPVQNTPTFDVKLGDILRPEYTLGEICEYLEKVEKRCLVVIDEFQQITRYPEKNTEALLRTHIQKLSNVNFVFSGSRRRLIIERCLCRHAGRSSM